jgi:autotransporter-associated beta strand protein
MKKRVIFSSLLATFLFLSALNGFAQASVYSGAFVLNEGWLDTTTEQQTITNFVSSAQKDTSIINVFFSWSTSGTTPNVAFPTTAVNFIRGHGSIPLLTWEPWNPSSGVNQSFTLSNIITGVYDSYIDGWATSAKTYPWCASVNGNTPAQYVQAWQHVHDLFVAAGTTNVTWVWCVNVVSGMPTPINELYPGDNYVDWIALDGYNRLANPWHDFSTLVASTVTQLTNIAPGKPIMVAETGCNQNPTYNKAQWFLNALTNYLPTVQPRIKAWVYFNGTNSDGNDWQITSPASAVAGYQQGIGLPYYDTNQYGAISSSPIQPLLNDATTTDTMAPFVSIVSPATDLVAGGTVVNCVALASDKSGVSNVVFSVNGVAQQTNYSPPYQFSWNVPASGMLTATIAATAYDNAGNSAVSTAQVVVQGVSMTNNILQTVTQTTGMDWNSVSWGTPAAVPVSGYNYETPNTFAARTPNSTTPAAFAGNSLQIDSGGILYLKNGGQTSGNAATVNLLLNGGMMEYHGGFAPNGAAVAGTLQVLANSIITTDQTGANSANIWVQSSISGAGNLTVNMNSTGNLLWLSGNNSAYTGNWTDTSSSGGIAIFSGTTNALGSGSVTLANAGSWLIFNSANNLVVNNSIGGAGSVAQVYPNTVMLSGSNTFTGSLLIYSGVLQLAAGGSIGSATAIQLLSGATLDVSAASGDFAVGSSQTLSGIGSVLGNVTVNGTVSPGPLGALNFANNLALSGTAVMELNRTNVPNADLISGATLALGGTLTVTNIGGTLQAGDSFQLFSGTITGTFATTNLPALSSTNLFWNTSKLSSQGILTVALKLPPAPTILLPSWNATNLTLQSDSQAGFNYVLQVTPQLSPANWVDIRTNSGGGTLTFVLPVDLTNTQQFFRIVVR